MAAAFRSIFALNTAEQVWARCDEVADMLTDRFPKAAALMADAKQDVLAFAMFPESHWRKIWSNNPLERLNKKNQTTHKRRWNLPQQRRSDPPDWRCARRSTRRMGHRSALHVEQLNGRPRRNVRHYKPAPTRGLNTPSITLGTPPLGGTLPNFATRNIPGYWWLNSNVVIPAIWGGYNSPNTGFAEGLEEAYR